MLQPPTNAAIAEGISGQITPGHGLRPNGTPQARNSVILQPGSLGAASSLPNSGIGAPPPPRQNGSITTNLTIHNSPASPAVNVGSAMTTPVPGRKPSAAQVAANPNAHLPPPYNLPPANQQPSERKPRIVRKVVKAPEKAERVLYCLSLKNPVRRLCISIVEWKYPFHKHFYKIFISIQKKL